MSPESIPPFDVGTRSTEGMTWQQKESFIPVAVSNCAALNTCGHIHSPNMPSRKSSHTMDGFHLLRGF